MIDFQCAKRLYQTERFVKGVFIPLQRCRLIPERADPEISPGGDPLSLLALLRGLWSM